MSPIILILGSGANVGQHVARAFAAKSYKVALASRRQKEDSNNADEATFSSDLSDPAAVVNLFAKVEATLGIPSVVVYNGKDHIATTSSSVISYLYPPAPASTNPINNHPSSPP